MASPETRKELTKLSATYVNGCAILLTGAGIAALPIALLRDPSMFWIFNIMGPTLAFGGMLMHLLARSIMRGLDAIQAKPQE